MARSLGIREFRVYVLTNGIFASAEGEDGPISAVRHVPRVNIHLGRVEAVNAISRELAAGKLDLDSAEKALQDACAIPVSYTHLFTTLEDQAALPRYDMAFITNPTSLHAAALELVRGRAGALFIEKPIFSAEETGRNLSDLLPAGQKAYVAAPMRWCGAMLALKKHLPELHPDCARVICSSYLPDWRPGVDYRTVYSAHKAMGGGVTIDLIHEWDYLVELFGKPERLYNLRGQYSELEIDSDDVSLYIARYPHLLAEVHLDYFGRGYRRSIELFCPTGSAVADFGAGTLTVPDGTVEAVSYTQLDVYKRQPSSTTPCLMAWWNWGRTAALPPCGKNRN